VRTAIDFLALAQLTRDTRVKSLTYPRGAVPDHLALNGTPGWGYGDKPAPRPSMDEALCFITLAWHAGHKAGWDATWQRWFRAKADRFAWAWESVPRNPRTGLVTQWTTPGHVGAHGIPEQDGACVMWGFHDSYGFPGDDLGCSVLACNAARALADMHEHAGEAAEVTAWSARADALRDAIRAQFRYEGATGALPWGVGPGAPTMASPDVTGYAVWSGILTDRQADAASDWFAACYQRDSKAAIPGNLFSMKPGSRGAVRMARKQDDCEPAFNVWPASGGITYDSYQNGGYWYYMSLPIAATLWRRHPLSVLSWVKNINADILMSKPEVPPERWDNVQLVRMDRYPFEHIDDLRPLGNAYLDSIGAIVGMSYPEQVRFSSNLYHQISGAHSHIVPM